MNTPADLGLREHDLELLGYVQEQLLAQGVKPPAWRADGNEQEAFRRRVEAILVRQISAPELANTALRLADAMAGLGILSPYLRDDSIDEIYVRGEEVAIERSGLVQRRVASAPETYWLGLIRRVADFSGRAIDPAWSAVLVDLPDGSRFTGLLPPVVEQPAINIRRFKSSTLSLDDLARLGTFEPHPIEPDGAHSWESPERWLTRLVAQQENNILIAGQFSSGKTTLLSALAAAIPEDSPVAVLETFHELKLPDHLYVVRGIVPSERQQGERGADMEWLLNTVYTRANPGVILVGEIVSPGEAMEFVKAANLGRRAYATIHGASVHAALARLETLALGRQPELGLAAVRRMVVDGLSVVALMRKDRSGARYLQQIARVEGLDEHGDYRLTQLYPPGPEEE
jgi:type IV secretory pathway ATPase VirB11/archaellum biosynthesis ATPase